MCVLSTFMVWNVVRWHILELDSYMHIETIVMETIREKKIDKDTDSK